MNIHERLEIFLQRLKGARPASNADEAMTLVCRLIEEVEDQFCLLPRENPPPMDFTGRMYAPQADMIKPWLHGGLVATARRHIIYCGADGRITIQGRFSRVAVLSKAGKPS